MTLSKEAIQHIQETAISPEDRHIIIDGRSFTIDKDGIHYEIHRQPVRPVYLSTLTSMVDFIKNIDFKTEEKLYLNIEGPQEVNLYSSLQSDNGRDTLAHVEAITPAIDFDRFKLAEDMVIELQAKFLPTDDRDLLLQVLGNLKEENVKNLGDDGVSQQVTIKKGVASLQDVKVPNPVTLAPFRTFHEVKQPESPFVFRMKEGGLGALFEADARAWKIDAIQNIKAFFEEQLKGMEQIIILA